MPIESMPRTGQLALVAALWLTPAVAARAQSTPLATGARVRVTIRDAHPPRTTGTLVAIGGDSLRYTPDGDGAARVVVLARLTQLEVGRGMHRHTWQGFVTGGAIGALSGVAIGYASGDDPPGTFLAMSRGEKAGLGGAVLGVVGGAIGTIVGFADRSERWERVAPPYTVTVIPERAGMRVAMRVAF